MTTEETLDSTVRELDEKFLKTETELGAVMSNLDSDVTDTLTGMSKIDFNSRLTNQEINCLLIIDELRRLGLLPADIGISRQKKRLSVSKDGKGREEKVRIVQGDREAKQGGGFFKNIFTRQP